MNDLPNLKCFSLTYNSIEAYDAQVIPLLRRMSHLKGLILYLSIENRVVFVDGTHLYNEILIHMPQLRTEINIDNSVHRLSINDIQQTFNKLQYQQMACIVNYSCDTGTCHVFSLPFSFDRLDYIGIRFGSFETRILHWNYTIFPIAEEINGFEFCISVLHFWDSKTKQFQYNQLHPIVEFPHLASLNVRRADVYYVEQFLNTEKTYLPRLTELEVDYDNLVTVTDNFTRDATRGNCAKVKWLIFEITIEYSRAVHAYFPSL
ncbi:unnamed protein product [Rotaria magnacalcarata]|uniref:Uncharacterized protein n=1 Tax=Rotaria magnacalcarata TaxID=392030 RepID=A0A816V7D2_9BILA|nr:unnamed protein product [Rotaria magnacalcarata]CAF1679240.1 unnamed protein product [Rotaria magnacalcarata]CAF2117241.1 unnamed protein product [Rotaria magnacalcarata]